MWINPEPPQNFLRVTPNFLRVMPNFLGMMPNFIWVMPNVVSGDGSRPSLPDVFSRDVKSRVMRGTAFL